MYPHTLTVGEFLAAVRSKSDLSARTIEGYAKRFRQIVATLAGIKTPQARRQDSQIWRDQVYAVPLASITPDKILAWRKRYVDEAGRNEIRRRHQVVSANSLIRNARGLFSKKKVLSKLKIDLPSPLPFDGVELERRTDTRFFGCGVDPRKLLHAAAAELAADHPEEFKVLLLSLVLGLRRGEIDWLQWSSFDFVGATLRVEATPWHALKTPGSAAVLPVEPEILALFRSWRARATREFVIESDREPKATDYEWYRCRPVFVRLVSWLREKGVQGFSPIHSMRKLFGFEMCSQFGIHAASSALRHSSIAITAAVYTDSRVRLTAGFGAELSGASVTPFPQVGNASEQVPSQSGLSTAP